MIQFPRPNRQKSTIVRRAPSGGLNEQADPLNLKPNEAEKIINMLVSADGVAKTRLGSLTIFETDSGENSTSCVDFGTNEVIFHTTDGTDGFVYRYNRETDTGEKIKTISGGTSKMSFNEFAGGDFMICWNSNAYFGVVHKTAKWQVMTGVSGTFNGGETVSWTGGSGVIVKKVGTTKLLLNITGANPTGTMTGAASGATGTASGDPYDYETVSGTAIPQNIVASALLTTGARTRLMGLSSSGILYWSKFYLFAASPYELPFLDWTVGDMNSTDGGDFDLSQYGAGKSIATKDSNIYCTFSRGVVALSHSYENIVDLSIQQKVEIVFEEKSSAAYLVKVIPTLGILFARDTGISLLTITDFGKKEYDFTYNFGEEKISELNFENADILFDGKSLVLISCSEGESGRNNSFFAYDTQKKAFFEFDGLTISSLCRIGNDIYGTDSFSGNLKKLFSGNTDDNSEIKWKIRFAKEDFGGRNEVKKNVNVWLEGNFQYPTNLEMVVDVWGKKGEERLSDKTLTYSTAGKTEAIIPLVGAPHLLYSDDKKTSVILQTKMRIRNFTKFQAEVIGTGVVEIHSLAYDAVAKGKTVKNNNLSKI